MKRTDERWVRIDLDRQRLRVFEADRCIAEWPVSSGIKGAGEHLGSGCTPRGLHHVRIKIGSGCPENSVFVGRRPSGEIYDAELGARCPDRDWILSRVIWLTGTQSGDNRGGDCDTLRRFIYIHGCPDSEPMGVPLSHGCIRMRNADVIELFDLIEAGTRVLINESSSDA
jgi:hypothetical protein